MNEILQFSQNLKTLDSCFPNINNNPTLFSNMPNMFSMPNLNGNMLPNYNQNSVNAGNPMSSSNNIGFSTIATSRNNPMVPNGMFNFPPSTFGGSLTATQPPMTAGTKPMVNTFISSNSVNPVNGGDIKTEDDSMNEDKAAPVSTPQSSGNNLSNFTSGTLTNSMLMELTDNT